MNLLRIVPIGDPDSGVVASILEPLSRALDTPCVVEPVALDPAVAYHPERGQYHSSELIGSLASLDDGYGHILGVTPVDLYIPILKYVFGEAQVDGRVAVVSYHRLRQSFYGLPSDRLLMQERLVKECLHELGHTFGLHHCTDYECVMASAFSVERIDIRLAEYCSECGASVAETRDRRVMQVASAHRRAGDE
jgi:archaemetzincin